MVFILSLFTVSRHLPTSPYPVQTSTLIGQTFKDYCAPDVELGDTS